MIDIAKINKYDRIKLIVGASSQNYDGWIQTQREDLDLLKRLDWEGSFGERKIHNILAEHVWEHLSYDEAIESAKILYDFLDNNGLIRIAVPDGNFRNEWYQNTIQVGGPGPKDHPAAGHKIVYTYKTIAMPFTQAGFKVDLLEYCDENGVFHFKEWDEKKGFIYRSKRFDHRNKGKELGFVSLIIDVKKN
ncbi:hypothetical protein SH1V18_05620 [Vallitalea longa]|uniref:SAM-dependent methyltransferase n=1 Tax=Vallitalea longa TaxID=2936439 RepID=A0A9W6DE69_9FIRM|nr:SAM-dependent methyltransferase [Vallitalea longa]GKX28082.1 hypothetical protein SH1V18_05620 [Vallitalea longa]